MKKIYSSDYNFNADRHTNESEPKMIRGMMTIEVAEFIAEREDREDSQANCLTNVFSAKTFENPIV